MRIQTIQKSASSFKDSTADLFCYGHLENGDINENLKNADNHFSGTINKAIELENFSGKSNKSVMIYGDESVKRIQIYGLGKESKITTDTLRALGAKISSNANSMKCENLSIDANSFQLASDDNLQAFCEGLTLGGYEFLDYKSKLLYLRVLFKSISALLPSCFFIISETLLLSVTV